MPFDAEAILARDGRMKSEKSAYDAECQEIGELMLPRQADFNGTASAFGMGSGDRRNRTKRIFDETALQSLDHFVTVFESEVIPPGAQWQEITPRDENLVKSQAARLWFEKVRDRLFALRNDPGSGWASQTHESIASLGAFGTQGMWVDIRRDVRGVPVGLSYNSRHIGELRYAENSQGFVDTIHREFSFSHRQAVQQWGDRVPECVKKAVRDQRNMDDRAMYLHVIAPNSDYDPGRIDAAAMLYGSCYIALDGKEVFDTGGYRSKPMTVSRYEKSPNDIHGRGPAANVLPAVRACQEMMADLVTAINFMARPALGTHDDMLDQVLNYSPGGITYGALNDRGNMLIQRLFEDPDIASALNLLGMTRDKIQRAFFEDLYTIRQEQKTHVSATDTMDKMEQRGQLLAPLARQETEWFTPMTARELDLMGQLGWLNDMPPEVAEAGGLYSLRYDNPLARARQAGAAAGWYQMLDGLSPMMQADPQNTVAELFRAYPFVKVMTGLARIHGVPASWESTDAEKEQVDEQRQAAVEKASFLEVGQAAAGIAKDLSSAQGAGGMMQ
jgi:hypothetical protein